MSKAQLFCLVNQTNVLWTCHKACKIEFSDCCYCLCSVCYASKVDEDDKKQERVLKKSRKRRRGTRNFDDNLTLCNHSIDTLCRGSSSDTTANKINPYYLIGSNFYIYLFFYTNLSVAKYRWYISVQG